MADDIHEEKRDAKWWIGKICGWAVSLTLLVGLPALYLLDGGDKKPDCPAGTVAVYNNAGAYENGDGPHGWSCEP